MSLGRPAPSRPPAALSASPSPVGLLKALRRRWVPALLVGLFLAGLAGGAVWFFLPASKYTAFALLHVQPRPSQIVFDTIETRQETKAEIESFQQTQLQLIKSRLVLNAALRRPEVAALPIVKERSRDRVDPLAWLAKEIDAKMVGNSELIRLSMSGDRPADLAVLVNAVMETYMESFVNKQHYERKGRLNKLREIYRSYQEGLKVRRETVERLAKAVGTNDQKTLALKHQLELQRQSDAQRDLMQLRTERQRAEAEIAVLQSREAAERVELTDTRLEPYVKADQQIQDLQHEIARLQRNLYLVRQQARGQDPVISRYLKELDFAQHQLKARAQQVRAEAARHLGERSSRDGQAALAQQQRRVAVYKELEQVMGHDVENLGKETRALNENGLELQAIQDEIAQQESAAKKVGEALQALEVESQAPPRITELERADPPTTKEDKRPMLTALASAVAFGLGLLGISWWEFQSRRISSVEEVVSGLGMRLVGSLPSIPQLARGPRRRSSNERDQYWASLMLESMDAVRTMLLHTAGTEDLRVVMVASAVAKEGKTSLASQLATSLARAGQRTLLVDCDLRNPVIHTLFDLPPEPGLSELMRNEADLESVLQYSDICGITVITAGQRDEQTLRSLAQGQLGRVLDSLRGSFDFIVVDSSPVLPVTDALLIGRHVDGVVFSILRDVSQGPKVFEAYGRMASMGIRILGAVVTGAPTELYGSSYRYAMQPPV